jgi:hypothetical protein
MAEQEKQEHSIEGLRIKCENDFYSVIKGGKCMECGKRVRVIVEE